jgi:hypothetical protein
LVDLRFDLGGFRLPYETLKICQRITAQK